MNVVIINHKLRMHFLTFDICEPNEIEFGNDMYYIFLPVIVLMMMDDYCVNNSIEQHTAWRGWFSVSLIFGCVLASAYNGDQSVNIRTDDASKQRGTWAGIMSASGLGVFKRSFIPSVVTSLLRITFVISVSFIPTKKGESKNVRFSWAQYRDQA